MNILSEPNSQIISGETIEDTCALIIAKSAAKASAIAALPLPLVDTAGVLFIQMNMIKQLSKEFHIRNENSKLPLISSIASVVIGKAATEVLGSFSEAIRINKILGDTLIKATIAGFVTTIIGEVYFHHFYRGGTLDNMDISTYVDFIDDQMRSERFSLGTIGHKLIDNWSEKMGISSKSTMDLKSIFLY
jgi:uncharacterized protein (DUF697 family)